MVKDMHVLCFDNTFNSYFLIELKISSRKSADICTGKTPMFKQLFLKMSAKKLEITQRNP